MNAREFLVTTVHEIAISTEFAITARPSEEADTHALTNRPALGKRPSTVPESEWHTPQASTRILTCLEAGSVIAFSTISNLPGFVTCTALYFVLMNILSLLRLHLPDVNARASFAADHR
jgi:hypothetical protein